MKKYQKIFAFLIVFMFFGTSWFYYDNYVKVSGIVKVSARESNKSNSFISMMYETKYQSGEYIETEDNSWPTEGYTFNATLSKCENGSSISWDDINKSVLLSTNKSDKCYVYFDALQPTLAKYIKSIYTTDGENGLYLHDADLANGANDGSYRYAGASDDVNNYVCFASDSETCPDDNLYRIIGVFGDQVKLIKSDYATSAQLGTDGDYSTSTYSASSYSAYKGSLTTINRYYWGNGYGDGVWAYSELNTVNLNTNYISYLNGINTKWINMIAETTWKVGGNTWSNIGTSAMNIAYQNEIVNPAENTTYTDEIGLMYVSDYGYAASPNFWTYVGNNEYGSTDDYRNAIGSNWMYMGLYEWTISRITGTNIVFFISSDGYVSYYGDVTDNRSLRPSFSLRSTVKYSGVGDGTKQNPYRLEEPPVISFTVGGNIRYAEEGMTWGQFIKNINYNETAYQCYTGSYGEQIGGTASYITNNSGISDEIGSGIDGRVISTDIIVENYDYRWIMEEDNGGGGG